MATLAELKTVLGSLSLAYPNYAAKPGTAEVYLMVLEDIPLDALQAGAKAYLSTANAFYPTPGQLREQAMNVMINRLAIPSEDEAWEDVQKQFRRCNDYYNWLGNEYTVQRLPEYKHPLIGKAVDYMGGYRMMYESQSPSSVDRAQFGRVYARLVERETEQIRILPSVRATAEKYGQLAAGTNPMLKQLADKMRVK